MSEKGSCRCQRSRVRPATMSGPVQIPGVSKRRVMGDVALCGVSAPAQAVVNDQAFEIAQFFTPEKVCCLGNRTRCTALDAGSGAQTATDFGGLDRSCIPSRSSPRRPTRTIFPYFLVMSLFGFDPKWSLLQCDAIHAPCAAARKHDVEENEAV